MPIYNSEAYKKWQEKYGVSQPTTNKSTTNSGKQSNSASSNKSKSAVAGAAKKGTESGKKVQSKTTSNSDSSKTKATESKTKSAYEAWQEKYVKNETIVPESTKGIGLLGARVGVDAVAPIEIKQKEILNLIQRMETAKSKTTDEYYEKRYLEEYDRLTREHANENYYPTAAQADNIVLGEMEAAEKEVEEITKQLERLQSGAREANWYDSTIGAIERGYLSMKAGKESYKGMQGHENEADAYNKKLATEHNTYTDNKAKQVLQFIGEFIGQQAYNLSDPRTIGLTITGAGTAAAAGQAGPQIAAPEEIITVPAAAIAGYTSGASLNTYEVSAGNTYETLKKLGVSDEVARNTSYGTGMVVALLESMQLDELVDAYTFGVKSGAADDLLKVIGNEILKRTKNSAVETTEEVLQEIASIGGESLAYGIDKGENLYSWEDVQNRLDETATTSLIGFGAMNVPAVAFNSARATINNRANNVNNTPVNVTRGTTEAVVEPQTQKQTNTPVNNNATQRTTTNNTNTPTQTTSIDPIEQAAREVVAERTRNNPIVAVETKSINGETITPEDAKKASAYGKYGSELLADAVNKSEGKSFSEVKGEMHIPYMAGYSNQNVNISTDFEQEAYFAGKKDRIMDNTTAKEKAKTATVYESGVVKNENFNKLSKASQEVLSTLAKDHKMSVEMQDKIVASIVNGVEQRAAGSHFDGKMEGSMATEKPLIEWAIHEDGHRMEQMATDEWNVLANALYERAERLGRRAELGLSQGTRFDKMKADHDRAGITKDTSGYFGEVVMRELETIFASPEEFNAWRAELDGNAQVKTAWQKFMDFLVELIDKAKATLAKAKMSKEARAQARAEIAELEHIKELYTNAYKATSDAVTKRANEVRNKETKTEVKSKSVESKPTNAPIETKTKTTPTYPSVKVGDVYVSNGNTYTITKRENGRTTYTVMRKNGDTSTKEVSNVVADINFIRADAYEKVQTDTNSSKNLEIKINEEYNGNISYAMDDWRTDLNATQYKQVEKWIRKAGSPETTKITDTANWYDGRIDGEDLFVIYSSIHADNPTILYERKGTEARRELDILLENVEDIENGRSIIEVSQDINALLSGDWLQEKHNLANNDAGFGGRGSNTGYASVLQGKSSKFIGSQAFRNVIKNLYDIQVEADRKKDTEGNTLTEAQKEYFKDSKVRDENGKLLVMYQGAKEDFSVFDRKKSSYANLYGRGFYFTKSENHASQYGKTRAYYLNIKHPVSTTETTITKSQLRKFLEAVIENEDYSFENYGYNATVDSVLESTYGKSDFLMLNDVSQTAIGDLVEAIELFNEVNGTDYDGIMLETETVTFNSEQAKLTSNENPTSNPDINFSLEEPVEETKNLIAVHNLWEEKLLKTLKLGGLPMPSIAIVRAREGHSNFGNISLVFRKDTISPTDRRNKVYSGDAWTPTYPYIEYKLNEAEQSKIEKKIDALVPKDVQRDLGGLYLDSYNMEHTLNRSGDMVASYINNYAMKYAFLRDSNIEVDLPMKNARLSNGGKRSDEAIIKVAETVPEKVLLNVLNGDDRYESEPAIRKAVAEAIQEKYKDNPELAKVLMPKEELSLGQLMGYAEDALRYKEEGIKQEVDYKVASDLINEKTDTAKYQNWLKELFSNIIAKEGIRNDKDLFTPSGNRRSFEALHYEHNLENVIKAMKEQGSIGIGGWGGNNILGASVIEYDSIERIKEAANERMKALPQEEYDEIRRGFTDRFFELAGSLPIHKDSFSATDDAANMLCEAVMKYKTKSGMANYLRNESKGWANYSDYIVDDLISLVNDIRNMPASYFEAKPQRAVGFNEIAAAIIPKSTSDELKTELKNKGIKTIEYDENKDGDRLEKVNSVPDVSFSLEETNNISTKDQKQLLDTIEQLKGQFEVTKFAKADPKKLAKMTRDILKEYDSKVDTDETRKAIDELYQYIANGEGKNPAAWNDVYNRAYKIAQNIVENALVTDDYMYQEYKSLRDYLRNTPLKFNSGYDSVPTAYESFNDFRKKNMGRLKFTNAGMSIDSFYQELSDLYPEYFDSEEQTNTADQLERIVDVLDEIQPTEVNPFDGQVQQASMHLANDLINRFFDIPQAKPTFADKAERRVINTRIKAKKQLDRVREQRDIKIEKEKAKRRDSLAKMSEKKKASVIRARIMRHTGELHKTLTKATDQKHIPPELENAVLSLLYNINLESNYTYDANTDSYKKNNKGMPTNKTNAFRALKEVYAEIAKNNDYGLTLASELIDTTNEGVANIFDEVMKLSDKKIADMTSEELTKIYDAIRIVEHSITTANKMFAMKKWEGLSETAKAFEKSVATRRAKHALMKSHLTLDIETPITFFSHFGEAGNELFQAFRDAQDNEQVMIDELAERVQKIVSLEQVQKAEKELFEFTTTEGKKLTLSKAHIMDIYLLYNRKQGKKHLLYDPGSEHFGNGIHQPEIKSKHIRRDSESTRLTKADLNNIISKLSAEDKAIADKLQKTTLKLAEWGNKACLDVFGYEKFNDPNYWTIKSAKESINQTPEKNKDIARSIKNMGSAKAVEDKATNALDIGGVFNVFNQHASDMICYSAWLGAMEDATKLYNYTFRDENGYKTNKTFVSMLEKYAGEGGSKYYFNLMKDIQNGIGLAPDTATERIYTKLFGMAAKAKVAYKATVVAQQPMAMVRAAAVLDPLSIMRATIKGGTNLPAWAVAKVTKDKINASEWYGGWERALKYAPIASRKAIGGYEINANDSGLKGVLYKPETKKGKFVDALKESPLWAAGKADEITWGILWNACEIETNKNKSLEKGSEEYYEAVAKRFTDVINETQVVDGVLQRSQLMRSSSGWIKPLTTFKGEPTMALNGVMRAYDNLRYEADPAKRGKAIKKFARATSVFLASAVFTAFARSLAVGGTGEDDEEYWKKVWKSFSGIQGDEDTWFDFVKNIGLKSDAVNNINPLTWLPIASELMSAMQGYDVERLDVASVTDFYNVAKKFIDSLDKEGKQTVGYSARQLLLKASEFTGYSPYNLIHDIEGAIRTVRVETNDVKGLYEMEKWRTKPASNVSKYVDILYKAYSTDSDDYEYIYNDMIENGVDAEKIETGMETRMKKAEGVEKTSELTKRYMSPDVEKKYDNSLSKIRTSDVWKSANATQRKEAEADLYNFLTSDSEDMKKARDEAILNDVDSSEYALWQIAIEMADQPKGEEGSGSYSSKEKAAAINSLNLGEKEMAYFYGKGLNEYAKDELNQVIGDGIDIQDYINFKAATSDMKADKNANGKSIPNSKKRKVVNYLNSANLTDEEWNYFYYEIMDYKK